MKKLYLAIVFVLSLCLSATAQKSDGFFTSSDNGVRIGSLDSNDPLPVIPVHNYGDGGDFGDHSPSAEAPLGTGLFLLTALGAGYAISKRRKEER